MKTKRVLSAIAGTVLAGGTLAYAQRDDPRQGPWDGRPQRGAQGMPEARMQPVPGGQRPCGDRGCPMMRRDERDAGALPRGGFGGAPDMRRERGPREAMGDAPRTMGPRRGPGDEGGRGMVPDPERARQAGATDQQIEALGALAFEQRIKQIELRAAVEKADAALDHLMKNETVDEKAALQAADALIQARGELFKLELTSRVKVRGLLGADVLKKLRAMPPPRAPRGAGPGADGRYPPEPEGDRAAAGFAPPQEQEK